jgi:hypothetical protein
MRWSFEPPVEGPKPTPLYPYLAKGSHSARPVIVIDDNIAYYLDTGIIFTGGPNEAIPLAPGERLILTQN